MNRLETIAFRERRLRKRDLLFAAFVLLGVAIGIASSIDIGWFAHH